MSDNQATAPERQQVIFDLNNEAYGVDIDDVREIVRMQEITPIAGAPEYVEGVITVDGQAVPAINLRAMFSMPTGPAGPTGLTGPIGDRMSEHRIVLMDVDGQDVGAVVDAVTEVSRVSEEAVKPVPNDEEYVLGVVESNGRMVTLIDISKIISADEAAQIVTMVEETAA